MIELKVYLKGIPFFLMIDGKKVVYERRTIEGNIIEKAQWFPPVSTNKKVLSNITPEEYAQWATCKDEEEVYKLIKFDLIRNGCKVEEKRNNA